MANIAKPLNNGNSSPLKKADDKSKRLELLTELQQSSHLTPSQKSRLKDEYHRVLKGMQGERDAAFYLDSYFKNRAYYVVMHDLRFVVEGDVAQIDHLVISRAEGMFLFETKNYAGNLIINEMGEFTAVYGRDRYGIQSPIEQSHRHERVLRTLLKTLGITPRLGGNMDFHHIVLLNPQAIITRPPSKTFDSSGVIKADQIPSWYKQFADNKELGAFGALKLLSNVRSTETIREWGEKLIGQHRPADLLVLPDFIKPQPQITTHRPQTAPPADGSSGGGLAAKLSLPTEAPSKKLLCAHCGQKITYAEAKFCWNNEKRFGGRQYCREHQGLF